MSSRYSLLSFDKMSEVDVREDVLVPLLTDLGYKKGTQYDIQREVTLRYPYISLGRRKEGRDPVLRGRADYVLKVNDKFSWVLEAKSPEIDLEINEAEQAWTYASHPEVRAAYFVLCNGRILKIFDSFAAPESREILSVNYEDLEMRFLEIANILAPFAIERQIAFRDEIRGVPLGPGLGSIAQIKSGLVHYYELDRPEVIKSDVQTIILGGTVQRDALGMVVVHLETQAPLPGMQAVNDRIGFEGVTLYSNAKSLPSCPGEELELYGATTFTLPAGESIPLPWSAAPFYLPRAFSCTMNYRALGSLDGTKFKGRWKGELVLDDAKSSCTNFEGDFFVFLT